MKIRIAIVGAVAVALAMFVPTGANGQGLCGWARDKLVKEVLESYGVPRGAMKAGEEGYDLWEAYLSSRDDEKLDAAARSITESILKVTVPGAGIAMKSGGLIVKGTQMLVTEEEALRIKAFVCGNRSFGALQSINFFDMREVQAAAPGVTCDNFEQRVTTRGQFERLERIWQGRFSRETRTYTGSDAQTDQMLGQGWALLRDRWLTVYAKTMYDDIKRKMAAEVLAIAEQECTAPESDLTRQGTPPEGWAGVYKDARFVYNVSGSATVLTVSYTSSDPTLDQRGSARCALASPTHAICQGKGDYRDEDKSIAYTDSWDATLSGDTISGKSKILTSDQDWREGVSKYTPFLSVDRESSFSLTRTSEEELERNAKIDQPSEYEENRAPDY
jgi:hypothetical protein